MNDSGFRLFDDDGTEIDPALISKPSLCVSCKKDDDPSEEVLPDYQRPLNVPVNRTLARDSGSRIAKGSRPHRVIQNLLVFRQVF
jgi:hypothetical protein